MLAPQDAKRILQHYQENANPCCERWPSPFDTAPGSVRIQDHPKIVSLVLALSSSYLIVQEVRVRVILEANIDADDKYANIGKSRLTFPRDK